jgi:hypothetical protein
MSIISKLKIGGPASSGLTAAREQRKIDRTIASGQRSRAKAEKASVKAKQAAVKTDIQKDRGCIHGAQIAVWDIDTIPEKHVAKPSGKKASKSRGAKR